VVFADNLDKFGTPQGSGGGEVFLLRSGQVGRDETTHPLFCFQGREESDGCRLHAGHRAGWRRRARRDGGGGRIHRDGRIGGRQRGGNQPGGSGVHLPSPPSPRISWLSGRKRRGEGMIVDPPSLCRACASAAIIADAATRRCRGGWRCWMAPRDGTATARLGRSAGGPAVACCTARQLALRAARLPAAAALAGGGGRGGAAALASLGSRRGRATDLCASRATYGNSAMGDNKDDDGNGTMGDGRRSRPRFAWLASRSGR
jgi:hypothetical protein